MGDVFTQRRILGLLIWALACMLTNGWVKTINHARTSSQSYSRHLREYEIIVPPLVLTSAYLLIVKPNKRVARKLIETTSANDK